MADHKIMEMSNGHKFGFVTVAGPPNAGKSTLINRLVGQKISITSRKPQTTRHRILGIKTMPNAQVVFVDTPGLHHDEKKRLNRMINRTAVNSLSDVDLIVFMIDHRGWTPAIVKSLQKVKARNVPVILVINKIDTLRDKSRLLPLIEQSSEMHDFVEIVPLSAKNLEEKDEFISILISHLPEGPPGFPADQISDRGERFIASELVREQTFHTLGEELPYESAVEVTRFDKEDPDYWKIDMIIWVDKPSQKSIVIGKQGVRLKTIGTRARKEMEKVFGARIYLNLWVKHRKGWADNAAMVRSLGYGEE